MDAWFTPETFKLCVMLCVAGAGACLGLAVGGLAAAARAARATAETLVMPDMDSALMRAFLPMARSLGLLLQGICGGTRENGGYAQVSALVARRLSAAGRPQGINSEEYFGYGILVMVFAGILGVFAWLWLEPEAMFPPHVYFAAGTAMGAWYWYSWLGRKRFAYQRAIQRELPFCLDLLTLAIEAGMDFTAALSRLIRKTGRSPLGREFALTLHEIQLGKQRSEALRDFSRRVDVPEVGTVVASLVQAEELGASLGPILRLLSAQQRERRSQRAEELAMKAPVKILFPLVVCMFPCVLIILAVPILLTVMGTGLGG